MCFLLFEASRGVIHSQQDGCVEAYVVNCMRNVESDTLSPPESYTLPWHSHRKRYPLLFGCAPKTLTTRPAAAVWWAKEDNYLGRGRLGAELVLGALLALDGSREAVAIHGLERAVDEVSARPLLVR